MVKIVSTHLLDKSDPTIYGSANELSPQTEAMMNQFDKEMKQQRLLDAVTHKKASKLLRQIPFDSTTASAHSLPGNREAYKRAGTKKRGIVYSYYINHGQLFWVKLP